MPVSVTPDKFSLVAYDPDEIAATAADVAARAGLPGGFDLVVEVIETSPMATVKRTRLEADGATLQMESGAFEDLKRPRCYSGRTASASFARALYPVADLLDPDFGYDGPADETELGIGLVSAWVTYALGRFANSGGPSHEGSARYHFRVHQGFSDAIDERFDELWAAERLDWQRLRTLAGLVSSAAS